MVPCHSETGLPPGTDRIISGARSKVSPGRGISAPAVVSGIPHSLGSQLPGRGDLQVAPWRGPRGEEQIRQHQTANCVSEPATLDADLLIPEESSDDSGFSQHLISTSWEILNQNLSELLLNPLSKKSGEVINDHYCFKPLILRELLHSNR